MDSASEEALNVGIMFLRIVSPFYFVIAIKLVGDGVLRGSSKMIRFMICTFTDLIIRVVLAYVLSIPLKTNGIWLAWPIGWSISFVLSMIFVIHLFRQYKRPQENLNLVK